MTDYAKGFATAATICAVLAAGPLQWWFTSVGERDAKAQAHAERAAMVAKCNGLAWVAYTATGEERGCVEGSGRARKVSK